MGISLGSQGMFDSDIIQVKANGTSSAYYDRHGVGNEAPVSDDSQDLAGGFTVANGFVTFKLSRAMDTFDANDYMLTLGTEILCAWAVNRLTSDISTKHTSKGMFGVYLTDTQLGRSYSNDPNAEGIPLLEWNKNINYDTDRDSTFLPAGPIPYEPQEDYYFFEVPTVNAAQANVDLKIIQGGWTLDGQIGKYQ